MIQKLRLTLPWRLTNKRLYKGGFNDQTLIGEYIATNPDKIDVTLDYDCKLFWCIAGEWEDLDKHHIISNNTIVNKHTNNTPSFIHVPFTRKYGCVFEELHDLVMKLNKRRMRK